MTDSEFNRELATAWRKGERAAMVWQHRHDRGDNPEDPKCPYEYDVDPVKAAYEREVQAERALTKAREARAAAVQASPKWHVCGPDCGPMRNGL